MAENNEQDQRERIGSWVKESRQVASKRKRRNHALIHLGLAILEMIRRGELTPEEVTRHVIQNKVDLVTDTIEEETRR